MDQNGVIIIAEDNDGHATLIEKNLRRSGIRNKIIPFRDGEELFNFLEKKIPGSYVLLLDINMPKVGGLEVLERLKDDEELKNIPICMLTTTDDDEAVKYCHDKGCNAYVTKPIDYDKFVSAIKQLGLFLLLVDVPAINCKVQESTDDETLKTVLSQLEIEKESIRDDVALNVQKNVMPHIRQLKKTKKYDETLINSIEDALKDLSFGFYRNLIRHNIGLTPAESRVCKFIKEGYQDKEIATKLSVSITTIQSHRKNIRRKFNITNTPVNLKTFLERIST
jgi:DNA-binding NarL/FixJ family response regulator